MFEQLRIDTEWVIIKPNWVSNKPGEFTEPEILDRLLGAVPESKKMVVESYTPWRGSKISAVDLVGGQVYHEEYAEQERQFLASTGIGEVLAKHQVEVLIITEEVWAGRCVEPKIIQQILDDQDLTLHNGELCEYIPQHLFELRDKATFTSLAKIKTEPSIPSIMVSLSVKNLFGLIPDPSRQARYHGQKHELVPQAIRDIYTLYNCLFPQSRWVAEGVKTWVKDYCSDNQQIMRDQNLLFLGRNGIEVDKKVCRAMGINPDQVPYLEVV